MGVYTAVKNLNDITMVFEALEAGTFDVLMSDPERQKEMQNAGVISKPVASILNKTS